MVGLPLILFKVEEDGIDMGDIQYLAIKEFDGKLVKNNGTLTIAGTLATLTAAGGKDMYLGRAKVNYKGSTVLGSEGAIIDLTINGTVVETAEFISITAGPASASGMVSDSYEFKNIGHKVTTTQIIKLEVRSVTGTVSLEGFVECFQEDTGTTPEIS